jgi:hypothetical protein
MDLFQMVRILSVEQSTRGLRRYWVLVQEESRKPKDGRLRWSIHANVTDLFQRYGDIVKEEALWNVPVVNIVSRESIEKVLKQSGKYPFRPPNEVTAHYRKSRPDRYTNSGLVNELVFANYKIRFMQYYIMPNDVSTEGSCVAM